MIVFYPIYLIRIQHLKKNTMNNYCSNNISMIPDKKGPSEFDQFFRTEILKYFTPVTTEL